MPTPNMPNSGPSFSTNPVPALIARRSTVLAPPSLSTVNHLDGVPSACSSSSSARPTRRHRSDFQQAITLATAAHPVSTRENISSSKTWSSGLALKHASANTCGGYPSGIGRGYGIDDAFAVHPTFECDAENRGDVLVRVDGVEFWVHKDVLMFSSPFFKSVLQGGWRESRLSRLHQTEAVDEDTGREPSEAQAERDVLAQQDQDKAGGSTPDDIPDLASKAGTSADTTGGNNMCQQVAQQPTSNAALVEGKCTPELDADDVAASELDGEHLEGEARRRSLLRASYHTALWSQDEEAGNSSTLSQCAAAFTDEAEDTGSANDSTDERGAEEEVGGSDKTRKRVDMEATADGTDEGKKAATKQLLNPARDAKPSTADDQRASARMASQQKASGSGLRQVRSKSRHLAARLTLRKLESAQRDKSIPTRSTSKNARLEAAHDSSREVPTEDAATGPLERLESLATPPVSRRPSQEAFCDAHIADVATSTAGNERDATESTRDTATPAPRKTKLPVRYHGIISVIDLEEESASTFHDFLFHTYPHLDLSVTWFNCGPLLRFSDKFQVPFLRRSCVTFLRAALAGKPIEAMRLAELHGMDDLYKEASRHVLDNFSAWEPDELEVLSKETLLKLERKRTWFLERLLKLGLANPARDYECHPSCPDPQSCARALHEKWQAAYANAFRFSPPQPSAIFRHLRELDGSVGGGMQLSSCQATSRVWVQGLFDRMFELGTLHTGRLFLAVKLDGVVPRNVSHREC